MYFARFIPRSKIIDTALPFFKKFYPRIRKLPSGFQSPLSDPFENLRKNKALSLSRSLRISQKLTVGMQQQWRATRGWKIGGEDGKKLSLIDCSSFAIPNDIVKSRSKADTERGTIWPVENGPPAWKIGGKLSAPRTNLGLNWISRQDSAHVGLLNTYGFSWAKEEGAD